MKKAVSSLATLGLLVAVVLSGCSGGGGSGAVSGGEKTAGKNSIAYAVIYSAPAGSCPNGGITVYAGIDTNGNGVLDPAEYAGAPQYVCNGANGANGNTWPVANAGPDRKVAAAGIGVTLDGSGSSDPDGNPITYAWSITARHVGSLAALSSSVVSMPTFTPDKAGKYELSLVVNDGTGYSLADSVVVRAGMPVPDTGQTRWYSTTFGDDGDYTINPMSYTDNGDGTILDDVTGLTWQKCSMGLSGLDCATGTAATYNWYQASGTADATYNPAGATNVCGSLSLAGSGWRLPTDQELVTIVDFADYIPAIDVAYFPNTQSYNYWSSTSYAGGANAAWRLNFSTGYDYQWGSFIGAYVRCVRGTSAAIAGNYRDSGNGTIMDLTTNLMWQQCTAGWSGAGCSVDDATANTYSWDNAIAYCQGLLLGGFTDWRLPSIKELKTIVDTGIMTPGINATYFPNTSSGFYWSSTTYALNTANAWSVFFNDGNVNEATVKIGSASVRCVRGQ